MCAQRPQCDSALRVPQSVAALTEEDGDEASELIDFWSEDSTNKLPKGALKKLGYKIVKNEESGEWEAVKRVGGAWDWREWVEVPCHRMHGTSI